MSDFTSDTPRSSVSDLTKRVRYSTGLVLGVDEFNQDQAYLMERDRLLTRALHGYGVVQGLAVELDDSEDLLQVRVNPGLAVDPTGQHVCVERTQCAVIKDWLAQQPPSTVFPSYESNGGDGSSGGSGSNGGGSPPDVEPKEVCLSVVLHYGTCATDFVPLPGEACRSAEESRAASRLADDFSLTLEFEKNRPPQVEEHASRLLGRLLRALQVRPSGPYVLDGGGDLKGLITALPEALSAVDDPAKASLADLENVAGETLPTDEDGDPLLRVKPGQETKVLRALETAWVRDTRRTLLKTGHDPKKNPLEAGRGTDGRCQPVPKGDDGVVLGTLCLAVEPITEGPRAQKGFKPAPEDTTDDGSLDSDKLTVSTEDRPRLLASRVLQETGFFDRVEPGSDVEEPDTLSIDEVADTLPTLPFATAELIDPARLPSVEASAEEVAIRIRFHLNTHETVTTQDNAYDVGEDFNVQVFSERSDPMTDYLYLTKESVQDRARLGRNVYVLLLRKTSVQNRPHLRLRFDLSEMTINRRAADGDGTRGEVTETFSGTEWVEERPVKWLGHDGTQHVTVFASARGAGGDLDGLQSVPRVTGIQGTSVSEDDPSEGDLLSLEEEGGSKTWRPTPRSALDFAPVDHNHTLDDLSDVEAPGPGDGEVLTWRNGTWVPDEAEGDPSTRDTDYVQTSPATDEPYAIVAAGEVAVDTTVRVDYGGLEVAEDRPEIGQFLIRFEGYQNPRADNAGVSYVIKGTPVTSEAVEGGQGGGRIGATFSVVRFEQEGIVVQSSQQAIGLRNGELERQVRPTPFVVEISQFEA